MIDLRPLDVAGDGNCFFIKAVSHQLGGTPDCHFAIRDAGIQYLRDHPEEFIESNVANSWLGYLNTMSMQGTWCDGLIVQAVANALGITLHIIESHQNFTERTIIEPAVTFQGEQRTIYLGHINEVHYVSTVPELFRTQITSSCSTSIRESKSSSAIEYHKNDYFRTYMRKRRANEKTMSVEKNGYPNNVNTNSNGEVYKENPQPRNLHNPKTHKKETPIKIVTVEKKGYPNNVNTHSNGELNKG